ncbi:hypothetical protein EEL30_01160 (plasmid) [Brevibacillus laterosporus]|uniref:Uncharacterized protein n=1 Tax=Brevibacillus laterosporus TaxID=1465 RepID=A0A518V298_BRELA|nr:hypothetical protein EEL30_01160 [Brevibacillus laterosporus]
MNKKASKWMIGALALAVFAPTAAFAATNANVNETKVERGFHQHSPYFTLEDRLSNQQELMKIINKYNPDLSDDFQKLFKLDEEAKKEIDEINEQVKNGTLTQEQANEKLGVKVINLSQVTEVVKFDGTANETTSESGEKLVGELDEETKKKLEVVVTTESGEWDEETKKKIEEMEKKLDKINEQVKNGTLTQEQADEEMEKLGVMKAVVKENIIEQIKVAADADDADTVNKLLQELLEEMENIRKHSEAKAE